MVLSESTMGAAGAITARDGGLVVDVAAAMPRAARRLLEGLWLALDAESSSTRIEGDAASPGPGPHLEQPGPGASTSAGARDDSARIEALVTLAQQGDAEAFGQIYDRYVGTVYRYLYVRTGNREVAQDLTSETFLRALRRIESFTWQGRDIAAWFITIARNLVIDTRKSAAYRLEVTTADLLGIQEADDAETPEAAVIRGDREARLVEALRQLTPDQAECVVLRFMEGLSVAECAQVLGRRENAVKQLQLRAIRALRKELDRGF